MNLKSFSAFCKLKTVFTETILHGERSIGHTGTFLFSGPNGNDIFFHFSDLLCLGTVYKYIYIKLYCI